MSLPAASWPAQVESITLYAGDTAEIVFSFKDSQNNIIDMRNLGTWKSQARPDPTSTKFVDVEIEITATNLKLSLSGEDTAKMQRVSLVWGFDVQLTSSFNGQVTTILVGSLGLLGDYTK